jgi:Ca-activated chloride channel family protein
MQQAFAHPGLLFALSALPVVSVLAFLAARRRQQALVRMAGLVGAVLLARRRPSRLGRLAASLGLTCLALGMAGPRWGRDWNQSAAPGRDLVVVLDLSRSMFAEAPSRLERACAALYDLAGALRQRGGQRVALVVFAGKPRLTCPLTHDLDHFKECLDAIDRSVPDAALGAGTRIGAALVLAADAFDGRSAAARDVLLLSDGDDPARDGEWRKGVERARADGVAVHVVGVGDPGEGHGIPEGGGWLSFGGAEVRTRLEEAPLRAIAGRTGGRLLLAGDRPLPLGEHYLALAAAEGEDSPDALPVLRQRQEWFLLPAFALLTLALILPPRGPRP